VGGGDDPTGALAATGGGISPMFAVAGGAALFAGISAVVIAAYRRRQAGMR
jgi:LPXTG-motif cell wall-anchored protein